MFTKNRLEEQVAKLKLARWVSFTWHLFHCGFLDALLLFVVGLALVLFSLYLCWIDLSWLSLWIDTWPTKIAGWLLLSFQFSSIIAEQGLMRMIRNQPRLVLILTCFFAASVCINIGVVINFLSGINAFPQISEQSPLVVLANMTGQSPLVMVTIMLTAILTYVPKLFLDGTKMISDGWSRLRLCLKRTQELDFI